MALFTRSVEAAPQKLELCCEANIQAVKPGDKGPSRFSMNAYTGGPMRIAGYRNPVVIDLEGIEAANESLPILRGHDDDRVVGHSTEIKAETDGLHVSGVVSGAGADAKEIVQAAKDGFPWQASVGAQPSQTEQLRAGKSTTINGQTIKGPAHIVRRSVLGEISFVARGADNKTSAAIAAKSEEHAMSTVEADPIQEERERVIAINKATAGTNLDQTKVEAIRNDAIESGATVEAVNAELLDLIRSSRTKPIMTGQGPAIHSKAGLPDSGMQAIEAAFLCKAGHVKAAEDAFGDQVLDSLGGLNRASDCDILAAGLKIAGLPVPHDRSEMIKAAVSNHNIQVALANTAHLSLSSAFRESMGTWRSFASVRSADNFKEHTSIRPTHDFTFVPVGKTGELKHGTAGEKTIPWKVDTYGKIFGVDRRDWINDSVRIFDELAPAMGRSAARSVSDLHLTTLLAAGTSYFDASLGNLGTAALSVASLGAAITAMRKQQDENNDDIDIVPRVLLVPPELEQTAKEVLNSEYTEQIASNTAAEVNLVRPTGNPLRSSLELQVESRLSNTNKFSNGSATAWYLFAGPADAPIIAGYLNGKQTPTVEFFGLDDDPKTLGIQWRAWLDYGSALGEYRAAYKSTGAA